MNRHTSIKSHRVSGITNQMRNEQKTGMSDINKAFIPNKPLIDQPNFKNQNNILHNNLNDKIMNEFIEEQKIHISSMDRNKQSYPSPFRMRTSFGNSTSPDPKIDLSYVNVKYITLDKVILPRTYAIDTTHVNSDGHDLYPTGSEYPNNTVPTLPPAANPTNPMMIFKNHKYLILKIKELDSDTNQGTSNELKNDTFILIPDCHWGYDIVAWKPIHSTIVYPSSRLKNFNELTFILCDEYGKEIKLVDQNGNNIINTPIYNNEDYNTYVESYSDVDSVKYTDTMTQVLYNFTLGIVKNEMSIMTNFNKFN